jgi:alpha-beta hydrolase superfamily lysophospholipase
VIADSAAGFAGSPTWVADVPVNWNGTLLLYSHGFGPLTALDAPDPATQAALLARGYALAGSSYDPNGSEWALDTAVQDQFGALTAVEDTVLPSKPAQVLAIGSSMGGLVSALEDQDSQGRIDGALTTCGIVAGGINLNEFQLDGEYAMAQLLLPGQQVQLTGFGGPAGAGQAFGTAATLTGAAAQAQQTPPAGPGSPWPSLSSTPSRGTRARRPRPRTATRPRRRPPSTT